MGHQRRLLLCPRDDQLLSELDPARLCPFGRQPGQPYEKSRQHSMLDLMTDPFAQAAAALADQPAVAERLARALIARAAGDPRPRLILASALRRQGRAVEALPILAELGRAYPKAARTRYELGLCLAATGRSTEAEHPGDAAPPAWPHREAGRDQCHGAR